MTFNSDEYAWKDITAVVNGRPLLGITGVKYGEKIDREYLYGKGNKPRAIQDKNISYEGELKVRQSELEALTASSPKKSILNLTLDVVTIAYAPEDGVITTDQLVHVKFSENMKELNQGDAAMEVTLPIMFLEVKYNV